MPEDSCVTGSRSDVPSAAASILSRFGFPHWHDGKCLRELEMFLD
jgi:hypothetical protein